MNRLFRKNLINSVNILEPNPLLEGLLISGASSYNLTLLSSSLYLEDWAYWGLSTASSFDHKATGGSQISNATLITTTGDVFHRYSGAPISASWTDGTPDSTGTNVTAGIYIQNPGSGFSFTVPAGLIPQKLTMYVGTSGCKGQLTATLSDNSVAPYVDSSIGTGAVGIYLINFAAAHAGQLLTITWVEIGGPYTPSTTNVALNFAILAKLINITADTTAISADSSLITGDS